MLPWRGDGEVELALAPSLRRRLALARLDESLLLQPVEARINAAGRWLAPGALLDVVLDRHAVSVRVQSDDGEQQVLLQSRQFHLASSYFLLYRRNRDRMQVGLFPTVALRHARPHWDGENDLGQHRGAGQAKSSHAKRSATSFKLSCSSC